MKQLPLDSPLSSHNLLYSCHQNGFTAISCYSTSRRGSQRGNWGIGDLCFMQMLIAGREREQDSGMTQAAFLSLHVAAEFQSSFERVLTPLVFSQSLAPCVNSLCSTAGRAIQTAANMQALRSVCSGVSGHIDHTPCSMPLASHPLPIETCPLSGCWFHLIYTWR